MISLIIPCYNEQETLPVFYKAATAVLQNLGCEYELLFVNDGSSDRTLAIVRYFEKWSVWQCGDKAR
jgi:Glycosyltransferases involved in cell wall biogenesis